MMTSFNERKLEKWLELGMTPTPAQTDVLSPLARTKVFRMDRGQGKTTLLAIDALISGLLLPGLNQLIVCSSKTMAQHFMGTLGYYCNRVHAPRIYNHSLDVVLPENSRIHIKLSPYMLRGSFYHRVLIDNGDALGEDLWYSITQVLPYANEVLIALNHPAWPVA